MRTDCKRSCINKQCDFASAGTIFRFDNIVNDQLPQALIGLENVELTSLDTSICCKTNREPEEISP